MKSRTRIRIATCIIVCCLLLAMVASVATAVPYTLWDESPNGGGDGNIYYGGGVFDGTFYTGQLAGNGPQRWGTTQVGSPATALLNEIADYPTPNPAFTLVGGGVDFAKSSTLVGGYIFANNPATDQLYRSATWTPSGTSGANCVNLVDGPGMVMECICAGKGNTLYMTTGAGARNTVYKYTVTYTGGTYGGGSVSLVSGWPITIATAGRFRGITWYDDGTAEGKLYCADFTAANSNIYEVNCGNGANSIIATAGNTAAGSTYQCVRYGDQIFLVGLDGILRTFTLKGGTWSATAIDDLNSVLTTEAHQGDADLYGIGVKGDGTTAKYAWITHLPGRVAFFDISLPKKVYEEQRAGGSIYYIGAVVGDTVYTGQINGIAQLWGDEQIGTPPTALLAKGATETGIGNYAKCSLPLGGYIYATNGYYGLRRAAAWETLTVEVGGQTPLLAAPDAICTDGTYIYATQGSKTGAVNANTNVIYKFAIDHSGPAGTLTLLNTWSFGDNSSYRFRAISCYNNKLYVANHKPGGQIYEVDPGTGAFTLLATQPTAIVSHYQVVRYGDQLFLVGLDCNLYTYTLSGGVWSLTSTFPTGYTGDATYGLFGIGVKGDGTTARYAWITGPPAGPPAGSPRMSFWDLIPGMSSMSTLVEDQTWDGKPVNVDDAVVTVLGPTVDDPTMGLLRGFWVENQDRTVGAFVDLTPAQAMPTVGNFVNVFGTASKNAAGEKTLTATYLEGGVTADPEVLPLFTTNKSMGLATGGVGLANDGLLVTVCGKATYCDQEWGQFYIDDGSGVPSDVDGVNGVKVLKADGSYMFGVPNYQELVYNGVPCYVVATGIVRLEKVGDTIIRRIDVRSDADLVITAL